MIQLDDNFLTSLGLSAMADDEKQAFLREIYRELELRVGMELAKQLTDRQLQEFESIAADETAAVRWLEVNCPNYKLIVAEEMNNLRQEISEGRDQILSA